MEDDDGHTPKTFRRTDRTDAPLYLARSSERRATTVTRGSGAPRQVPVQVGGRVGTLGAGQ